MRRPGRAPRLLLVIPTREVAPCRSASTPTLRRQRRTAATRLARRGLEALAQYYTFVRYGRHGSRYIMETMMRNTRALAEQIAGMGPFRLVGEPGVEQLPADRVPAREERSYDEFDIASQLAAERGWMVPAHTLPPHADHVTLMRALAKLALAHGLATRSRRASHRPARRSSARAARTSSTAGE